MAQSISNAWRRHHARDVIQKCLLCCTSGPVGKGNMHLERQRYLLRGYFDPPTQYTTISLV